MIEAATGLAPSPAMLEGRMLDLFAPPSSGRSSGMDHGDSGTASLWRLDAIHRAKNPAQLSLSLANMVSRPSADMGPPEAAAPARALARAYDALCLDPGGTVAVPCLDMVTDVATRLTQIFGRACNITVEVSGSEVMLIPEKRRALVLICSELIINALKYAFPTGAAGLIRVTLRDLSGGVEMVVTDEGVGLANASPPGAGAGLLDRLAAVSGTTLTRAAGSGGTGLRVVLYSPPAALGAETLPHAA